MRKGSRPFVLILSATCLSACLDASRESGAPGLNDAGEDDPRENTSDSQGDDVVAPPFVDSSVGGDFTDAALIDSPWDGGEDPPDNLVTHCPNGTCEPGMGESAANCPADCCMCGDGVCDSAACGETFETCCADCSGCGNGECAPCETPATCPEDCCGSCGDGKCIGFACKEPEWCPKDCGTACGNKTCDQGEDPLACPEDCAWKVCGDGVCSPEDYAQHDRCPQDCGEGCGNGKCEKGEDWLKCPVDCGFCGDGYCVLLLGETAVTCAADCV
ncbi:MAG: hypothetical protein FJ087_18930 [Deltaproteobacteria bacterium]|nr:hypothetical protein [Deltaproteobacteria bacterium]